MTRPLIAALCVIAPLALTGCADPYRDALESPTLARPEAPLTTADQRALAPYDNSPYFHNQPEAPISPASMAPRTRQ